MNYTDKNGAIERINKKEERIVLELGCGTTKQFENSIALDIVELPKVDIVCDLNLGFPFLVDNSVDEIHSSHFLEHVDDVGLMMKESYRVLKTGGKCVITGSALFQSLFSQ